MIGVMASLRMRNGMYFIDYRVDGKRRRLTTKTSDKKVAGAMLKDIEAKIARAKHLGVPFEDLTAAETAKDQNKLPVFFRRFTEHCRQNYAQSNLHSDLARLRSWQQFFANKRVKFLEQITPGIVNEYTTVQLAGKKPKTIKNHLTLLKTALNYAVEWGLLEDNPIARVRPPKIVKTFRFFEKDELRKLIAEADEPLKSAIIILANTGLRRAELYHLRWRDVDLRKKILRVWPYEDSDAEFVPKDKEPRTIPLNKSVLNVLKSLDREEPFVYRPFYWIGQLSVKFMELVRRLGMTGKLNDLRHTFASRLASNNIPLPAIQELLGHSDIRTTMIYAHLSPSVHSKAVESLDF